jgi:predicted ferric reductase
MEANNNNIRFSASLGLPLVIIASIVPLIFWIFALPFSLRFINIEAASSSLGQITGLIGFAMFAIVTIIGARYKAIDALFMDLCELENLHHFFGSLSLILILLHPILLSVRYITYSMLAAAEFFMFTNYWPRNFGVAAIILMIVIFIVIYYFKKNHTLWLLSHQFLAIAFLSAIAHTYYSSTTFSTSPGLKIYMIILWALALYSALFKIAKNIYRKFSKLNTSADIPAQSEECPVPPTLVTPAPMIAPIPTIAPPMDTPSPPTTVPSPQSAQNDENNLEMDI